MSTILRAAGLAGLVCLISACTTPQWAVRVPPPDTPQAKAETVHLLKQAKLRPLSLGAVAPVPGSAEVTGEATHVEPPVAADAEAAQLRDTLQAQLQGAALYDTTSPWVLSGTVSRADLRKDHGTLAARFTVLRADGVAVYERELRTSATWAPALGTVGARWISREHDKLYQQLVAQLFSDPGFQQALKR